MNIQGVLFWNYLVFVYFVWINLFNLLIMVAAFVHTRRYIQKISIVNDYRLFRMPLFIKPISILAPAYNEELTVKENITSLLNLNYPQFEVILINDGSKDDTLKTVVEGFGLKLTDRAVPADLPAKPIRGIYTSTRYPNLVVVDKENGGKADALNVGLNVSRFPLFMAIDADSLLEKDALLKMVRPYLERPETVAVGGVVRIVNDCVVKDGNVNEVRLPGRVLPRFQVVEYMRAFLFGRMGWRALNMVVVISGAMGLFKKEAVIDAGGYQTTTVGEDMELVLRLHHSLTLQNKKYSIDFLPDPVCWTEAPETLAVLGRQRKRWHRGLMECLVKHRGMALNPRFGRVGMVALPYYWMAEGLGPFVEVFGQAGFYVSWGVLGLDSWFVLAFLCASVLLGIVQSMLAMILEELTFQRYPSIPMIVSIFFMGVVENLGYRQINTWWRLMGVVDYLRGKHHWGDMPRVGFKKKAA
ncbi:MAG: glycosyltransferase family 2 protein [Deltaproteobacteria bacterium]|nr:glycosyltransferase family 2 protein [Deltaproteobacteria bacterium]